MATAAVLRPQASFDERPAEPMLSVRDLSIDFHLRTHILHAVRQVSFDLFAGRTLCLVGESGSGKSVTARALLRIIDRQARVVGGRITLNVAGRRTEISDLGESSREIRAIRGRRIGLIFQEPMSSLSPVRTIGAQIIEVLRLHRGLDRKAARAETIELLRQVEIANPEQMVDRYTFEFSGGMRQRAMIAMALAGDPDILIADEPTTALDVTTQAESLDLIKRLQTSRGMAMLLITHDLGIVAEVADEVAVMRYGRIVEQGPVDDIFHAPRGAYTRELLGSTVKLQQPRAQPQQLTARTQPVLSVRGLTKVFGAKTWTGKTKFAVTAVEDASLDLHQGENLGIVGESGSGKTTLGPPHPAHRRAKLRLGDLPAWRRTRAGRAGPVKAPARRLSPPSPAGLPGSVCLAQSADDGEADRRRSALYQRPRPRPGFGGPGGQAARAGQPGSGRHGALSARLLRAASASVSASPGHWRSSPR